MSKDKIRALDRIARELSNRKLPQQTDVVDAVAEARDASALPALRRTLSATLAFQTEMDRLTGSTGLAAPWMAAALVNQLETNLRRAIEQCTPEGDSPRYGLTDGDVPSAPWWRFWRR